MSFYGLLERRIRGCWRQVVVLFLFSFLFSAVILGCITVFSAADSIKENVGKYVKGTVRVYSCDDEDTQKFSVEGQRIPCGWIQETAEDDRVKDYAVMSIAAINGVDVQRAKEHEVFLMGPQFTEMFGIDFDGGSMSLIYKTDMMDFYRFSEYGERILEGRPLKRGETGNKAVVGETIAENNGLSVGDTFEVESMSGKKIPLEIVGISSFSYWSGETFNPPRGAFFEYIFTTKEVVDLANGTDNVFEVMFELADCAEADSFLASIQEKIGSEGYLTWTELSDFYSARQAFKNIQVTVSVLLAAGDRFAVCAGDADSGVGG